MKSKKLYQKGDKVVVHSWGLPEVKVSLLKRYLVQENNGLGVNGWEGQIFSKKDVDKLRKKGVPYKKDDKPEVWVFDWHIVRKIRPRKQTKNYKSKRRRIK